MANQFSVTPLGGFNVGQGVAQIGEALNQRAQREIEQQKIAEQERQQLATQELIKRAVSGDDSAIPDLYATNPQLGAALEQRLYEKSQAQTAQQQAQVKQQTQDVLRGYFATPKEQRAQFLQQVSQDPQYALVTADDELLQMPPEAQEAEAKMAAYGLFGEDFYRQFIEPEAAGEGFTLKPGEIRYDAQGNIIAGTAEPEAAKPMLPQELVRGLPEEVARSANAAYQAAGGGSQGFKASQEIINRYESAQSAEELPKTIAKLYPNATEQEREKLVAAAAADPKDGLKTAAKMREEQRRLEKAEGFKERAVNLIDKILKNDQLDDVIGSIEGSYDFRLFSDAEAELISDIEEAQNILTAENMDLMSGVLSESDIKLLKNLSSGALNRKRTPERFRADAQTLRDKLAGADVESKRESSSVVPEGTIIRNQSTGERLIMKGGDWEPYNG